MYCGLELLLGLCKKIMVNFRFQPYFVEINLSRWHQDDLFNLITLLKIMCLM